MNAQNPQIFVFYGFDHTVFGCLCNGKSRSCRVTALMVGAVDQTGTRVKEGEKGSGDASCRMDLVRPLITVPVCSGKILDQGSPEVDVDHLHASADTENRFPMEDKAVEKGKLYTVQFTVRSAGTLICPAKPGRMDIAAAGK